MRPGRKRWSWAVIVGLVVAGLAVARAARGDVDDGRAGPGGDACVPEPTLDIVEFTDGLVPPNSDLHEVQVTATVTNVAEVPIRVASVTIAMVGAPDATVGSTFDEVVAPGESFEFRTYASVVELAPGLAATPDETTAEVYWQPFDVADQACDP